MSQVATYVVADGSGLSVRTQINDIYAAIQSSNGGTSEPPSPVDGMLWWDPFLIGLQVFQGALSVFRTVQLVGNAYPFNSSFSTSVGGYNENALVASSVESGYWISMANSNTNDPDIDSDGWFPIGFSLVGSATFTGGTHLLNNNTGSLPVFRILGALTSNLIVTLPPKAQRWLVTNETTGAFTVTIEPPVGGTGVVIPASTLSNPIEIYGDGTNINFGCASNVQITALTVDISTLSTEVGLIEVALSEPGGLDLIAFISAAPVVGAGFTTVASLVAAFAPFVAGSYYAEFICDTCVNAGGPGNLSTQFVATGGSVTPGGGGFNVELSSASAQAFRNQNIGAIAGWAQFNGDQSMRLSGVITLGAGVTQLDFQWEVSAGSMSPQPGAFLRLMRVK